MDRPPVRVGVVDIGTNSMRLLMTDGSVDIDRKVEVTGLGRGVDRTGNLSPDAIEESLAALARFRADMDRAEVEKRAAIATSASRDAANREDFFDLVESALGVRPSLITGEEEARLAFAGATRQIDAIEPIVVSDIGGGSTEFVSSGGEVSFDIGSVRLTERAINGRPASPNEMSAARELVAGLFAGVDLETGTLIGVAGTWTSLAAIAQEPSRVLAQAGARLRDEPWLAGRAGRFAVFDDPGGDGRHPCPRSTACSSDPRGGTRRRGSDGHAGRR